MSTVALTPREEKTTREKHLQVGRKHPLLVRTERVNLLGEGRPLRLLYASDLHLTGHADDEYLVDQLLEAARQHRPDATLLGGDLVDSRKGPNELVSAVRRLSSMAPVLAVRGNHDQYWGVENTRAAVVEGGGCWIEDRSVSLRCGEEAMIRIEGTITNDRSACAARVLCAHDPAVFPKAIDAGYSLVLAGHLHGGQCVLAEMGGRLYPGALFYRYNGLRFYERGASMFVSRGAADTLPIRWNCPREVILCEIC